MNMQDLDKRKEEINNKLSEIFNKENKNVIDGRSVVPDENHYVKVGTDHKGNDIVVNTNPSGGLELSPEIWKKINDPEWVKENKDREKKERKKFLDSWFKGNANVSGPLAEHYENSRDLFEIPKEFAMMLGHPEDEDDELDLRSKNIIKRARQDSTLVDPDLLKGLDSAIKDGGNFKNAIHLTAFLKYLKSENVDFQKMFAGGPEVINEFFLKWKKLRRPSPQVMIQRLIKEADDLFFQWLDGTDKLDADVKLTLRRDTQARVEFLNDMQIESGQKLFTIDDFILQKFQFQEYGLFTEDAEWFNRNKLVPNTVTGQTMGDLLEEFELRTGWRYEDIYYHYWKEVEEENKNKVDGESMVEDIDKTSLVEGKENETQFIESERPDITSDITRPNFAVTFDDNDII